MSANAGEAGELQAFLNAHPRRLYRQGAGYIPIKAIRAGQHATRGEADPKQLEELVASIRVTGVIQALIVRPMPGVSTTSSKWLQANAASKRRSWRA